MKTFTYQNTVCFLLFFAAGCAAQVVPNPAQPLPCPADYCARPVVDATCVTEGDSPVWGPGPQTYCPTADGTEWNIAPSGDAIRYVKQAGAADHTPSWLVCEVSPGGQVYVREIPDMLQTKCSNYPNQVELSGGGE